MTFTDGDSWWDIYERAAGTTTLGSGGDQFAPFLALKGISADGTRAFFSTTESLAASDTDTWSDIYERSGGTTTLVSGGTAGVPSANTDASFGGVSQDGSRVFFTTAEPARRHRHGPI